MEHRILSVKDIEYIKNEVTNLLEEDQDNRYDEDYDKQYLAFDNMNEVIEKLLLPFLISICANKVERELDGIDIVSATSEEIKKIYNKLIDSLVILDNKMTNNLRNIAKQLLKDYGVINTELTIENIFKILKQIFK